MPHIENELRAQLQQIEAQQQVIRDLSTPILSQLNTQRNLRAALNDAIRSMTRAESPARSGDPPAGKAPAS